MKKMSDYYDDYGSSNISSGKSFWIKLFVLGGIFAIIIFLVSKKSTLFYRFLYMLGGFIGAYLSLSGKWQRKGFIEGYRNKRNRGRGY